jgi:hypothetical protein
MGALEFSRAFFEQTALPVLQRDFPEATPRIAAGLVGNGSECFGYDDELSRDHDWGVDFFLWIREEDREALLAPLSAWKQEILRCVPPELSRHRSNYGDNVGVMTVGDFYRSLIGVPHCPETLTEWRLAPEENFAMAVNGEVFYDPCGEFTAVRTGLLGYFPEDLRLKRAAAACMALAQTGQYNFLRMAKREDWVALLHTRTAFSDEAIALVFLLNRVYRPYYKWAWRRMTELPILGREVGEELRTLALSSGFGEEALLDQRERMERICVLFRTELNRQGLSDSDDCFLIDHGEQVQRKIQDSFLRSLPPQVFC